jgi:hypothetical protein
MKNNLTYLLSFIFILLLPSTFWGASIKQVKNKKVLIQLDNIKVKVGDQVYGVNSAKKKTSIMQIVTVKGDKAIAQLLKGNSAVNDTIVMKSSASKTTAKTNQPNINNSSTLNRTSFIRKDLKKLSLNLKLSNDSIATQQQDRSSTPQTETVEMSGMNFGFNAHYDIPLTNVYSIKSFGGIEMLKIAKTSTLANTCDGKTTSDCNVNINYLTFGGLLKASMPIAAQSHLWGALGVGFKQPLTKKSTALTEGNISLANALILAFGVDYHLNNKNFIPVSFEYQKSFNESETVPSIKHMGLNIGYGYLF